MNYALMIDISTLWKVDGGANEFRANVFNHVHLDVSAYLHDWKPSRPALAKRVAKLHSNDIFNLSRLFSACAHRCAGAARFRAFIIRINKTIADCAHGKECVQLLHGIRSGMRARAQVCDHIFIAFNIHIRRINALNFPLADRSSFRFSGCRD